VNKMKKTLPLVCIIFLVFSIAGCSKPAEPVAQAAEPAPEAQPAAVPEPQPVAQEPAAEPSKQSGVSALVGNWSLEAQYVWDSQSGQWAPGIPLEDGTMTQTPPEPIITEILGGIDTSWCPDSIQETGAEYITILPGGCWKVSGNTMAEVDLPPDMGTGEMAWEIKDSNLEMDITFKDPDGTVSARNKAVLIPLD
jgi:hypothetical protein